MMQLFVYSDFYPAARAYLRQQLPPDIQPIFRTDLPADQQQASFQQADLLLGNVPTAWLTAGSLPSLRFWQIDSAGFQQYAGVQAGFPVANVGDYFAWPCAETMTAGLLALYRRLPELAVLQAERRWVGAPIRGRMGLLREKRVVILGAGAIGLAVRQQLSGFGCAVLLFARTSSQAQIHSKEDLLAILPDTDIVVNCLPGSADGFFTAGLIAALPEHAIYASVGRGNTTNEPALIAALQAERLGGAVLDVTATEPLPTDSPLWNLPNVLLTQHTGGGQPLEDEGKVDVFLENLQRLQADQPLDNLIDLNRGY